MILDEDSGEAVGAVRNIDALDDGTEFGVVWIFDAPDPPTYMWLRGLLLLPVAEATRHVRTHLAWALRAAAHA
ncbi:MAG TPA: hypothetical protein VEK11_00930 [Thermoanaerobaculia bacterium]|nr:hypothetical protein [Thermoanaerobaculia bacterium]